MEDDVPADVKQRRLAEIIALQGELSRKRMKSYVGKNYEVLIEGESKKDKINGKEELSECSSGFDKVEGQNIGDFVTVFVHDSTTQGTLLGENDLRKS